MDIIFGAVLASIQLLGERDGWMTYLGIAPLGQNLGATARRACSPESSPMCVVRKEEGRAAGSTC